MKHVVIIKRTILENSLEVCREYYLPRLFDFAEYFRTRDYFNYDNLQIRFESWWIADIKGLKRQHRTDGPASCSWYENGQLCSENWYLYDHHHRIGGPAAQYWDENGQDEKSPIISRW